MADFLDRWDDVDRILQEALELPEAERRRFVEQACGDDAELRRHVERLLSPAVDRQDVLDLGADALAGDLLEEDAVSLVGNRVGAYEVVREIGSGGMGTVYEARRVDGAFDHRVALKIVRRGMATADVVRRFRHERQVLASLQHPNIAALFDGGITAEGLPYLAMEYVEGIPITDYCDQKRLTPRARLRLFCTVCGAVQHAHQNLVIHRDLKPSNILVTDEGTVKLLDFGIAKLLDDDAAALPLTRTGDRPMTPEYASPEQITGDAVTTTTDVYALGVLLYELLTGVRPYRIPSRLQHEIARVILEEQPTRPSTALTHSDTTDEVGRARATRVESLRRMLRGDLDNITLKALAKEPGRRYGTADQFAADVLRFLDGMPVQARPATVRYLAGKFVRRHSAALSAAAVVLVLISSLVGFYTLRLAHERDRAELEAAKATQIKDFLVGLFDAADPDRRESATALHLLDAGTERIDTELALQPEIQTEMMATMAVLYEKLGRYDRADSVAAAALDISRRAFPADDPRVADALYELGVIRRYQGRYTEADSLHRSALAIRRLLPAGEALTVAQSTNELGIVSWNRGAYPAAESLHRETLAIRRSALGDTSVSVSASLNNLALVLVAQSRPQEAIPLYEEALAIRRERLGPRHSRVAIVLSNLALAHMAAGRSADAEPLFRDALDVRREVFGSEHPLVANVMVNLGANLLDLDRLDEAEPLLRDALDMRLRLLGPDHPDTHVSRDQVARLLQEQGHLAEAEALHSTAIAETKQRLGPGHPDVARQLLNLGETQFERGRLAAADATFGEALAIARRSLGDDHRRTAAVLAWTARVRLEQKKPSEAAALFQESVDVYARSIPGSRNHTRTLLELADLLHDLGRHGDAAEQYRAGLQYDNVHQQEARRHFDRCAGEAEELMPPRSRAGM